jgi:hypothetical protein
MQEHGWGAAGWRQQQVGCAPCKLPWVHVWAGCPVVRMALGAWQHLCRVRAAGVGGWAGVQCSQHMLHWGSRSRALVAALQPHSHTVLGRRTPLPTAPVRWAQGCAVQRYDCCPPRSGALPCGQGPHLAVGHEEAPVLPRVLLSLLLPSLLGCRGVGSRRGGGGGRLWWGGARAAAGRCLAAGFQARLWVGGQAQRDGAGLVTGQGGLADQRRAHVGAAHGGCWLGTVVPRLDWRSEGARGSSRRRQQGVGRHPVPSAVGAPAAGAACVACG